MIFIAYKGIKQLLLTGISVELSLIASVPCFICVAAHLLIPHSKPKSANIFFSLLITVTAFCSD